MKELAVISDIGVSRACNEDAWDAIAASGLYIIADGLGGHRAGEVAAKQAVSFVSALLQGPLKKAPSIEQRELLLTEAIVAAAEDIYSFAWQHRALEGMGTTLAVLHWDGECATFAYVGDSRIYYIAPDSQLTCITNDHTVMVMIESEGRKILKHRLTQAVGTAPAVNPGTGQLQVNSGCFLLCTDGLTCGLSDAKIAEHLRFALAGGSLDATAEKLVEAAKANGSCDNITVMIVRH